MTIRTFDVLRALIHPFYLADGTNTYVDFTGSYRAVWRHSHSHNDDYLETK